MAAPRIRATRAIVITCRKKIKKTIRPSAPSDFRMAMSKRLRSRKADTASLAPTPPTPSAVSPTKVKNIPTCSTKRRMPGAASLRSRICQPGVRKSARGVGTRSSRSWRLFFCLWRERHAIGVIDQAAGLLQAGARPAPWMEIRMCGPSEKPVEMRSGSLLSTAIRRKVALPSRNRSPRLTWRRSSKVCSAAAPHTPSSSQWTAYRPGSGLA